ncbi:MAG: hypothetical protein ABI758_01045 [Candidatus Woesebacteria bacterium]
MAKIEATFPESFQPDMIQQIKEEWERNLSGHSFEIQRAQEYAAVQLFSCDSVPVNPGFFAQLSSPIEQALGNANFQMDLTAENTMPSYRNGQWQ